jgi:hypothetical protein
MARKNVRGTCRLCRKKNQILCKSHYIARAFHAMCRQNGEDPVVMTPNVSMLTPRQVWAHLLCHSCEALLNKNGETPVLKLVDDGASFPLLEHTTNAVPLKNDESGAVVFSGKAMGIDTDALAHFALGFLWKGAVYAWPSLEGQKSSVDLGAYKERIRTYLLGETGFPVGVYVAVGVCEDMGSRGFVWAPAKLSGLAYNMFSILTRGLWFHVITDDNAPKGTKDICCVQSSDRVLHRENCATRFLEYGRPLNRTARVAPNLQRATKNSI